MAQKVTIPISFVDSGNSAKQLAESIEQSIKKSNLSNSIKTQTDKIVADLKTYSQNAAKYAGKTVNPKIFASIYTEGKTVHKQLLQFIKEINNEVKTLGVSEEIAAELDKSEAKIDASVKKQKQNAAKAKKLQRLDSSVKTDKGEPIPGFGNYKDIDVVQEKIDAFYIKLENSRAQLLADPLNEKFKEENAVLESQIPAVEKASKEIANRKEKIEALTKSTEQEEIIIQNETKAIADLTTQASANPLMDPNKLAQITSGTKKLGDEIETTADKMEMEAHKTADLKAENKGLNAFAQNLKDSFARLFGAAAVFNTLRRVVRESIDAVKELDKAFNEIAMVTTYTTQEVWDMKESFTALATTTGLTLAEVSKAAVEFFRQGRSLSETTKLIEAAGIASKLSGSSMEESIRFLTSAINGYQLSADQAMVVSDKFAALAAASATDYAELATALSKVAAQAYSAGVNMDNMMGFIAKAIETTREAPENIGTAFKTIFARMSEIKDYGKTLEDGMDVNRVDKALATIGVSLTNQEHQIRNLDEVLMDVGYKWKTLDKNQKAYIATSLAGTRQQTRLLAVMENFDRTVQLTKISQDSLGASYAQQQKYYESIAYATAQMTTAWQNFITSIVSSKIVIIVTNFLTEAIKLVTDLVQGPLGALLIVLGSIYAAMTAWQALNLMDSFAAFALGAEQAAKDMISFIASIWKSILTLGVHTAAAFGDAAATALLSTAADGASLSLDGFTASMAVATLGITAVIAAVVALVGWLGKMAWDSYQLNGTMENLAKSSKKFTAEVYSLTKKTTDIKTLKDQYDKLDGKINKTSEDQAKMNELVQQMNDLAGEEAGLLDLEGNLDIHALEKYLEDTTTKINETFQDGYNNVIDGLNKHADQSYEDLDAASKALLDYGKAAELAGKKFNDGIALTRTEFLKLDQDTKDYYANLATAQDKAAYGKKTVTTTRNANLNIMETVVKVEPTLTPDQVDKMNNMLGEEVFNNWSGSNALQKAEILMDKGYADLREEEKTFFNSVLDGADTVQRILDTYGNNANEILSAMGDNLDLLDSLLNELESFNLDKNITTQLVGNIARLGAADAFNGFIKSSDAAGLSLENVIALGNKFNEIEFKDIDTTAALGGLKGIRDTLTSISGMLGGSESFDISALKDAVNTYPQIAKFIKDNGQLTTDEINKAITEEDDRAINQLDNENIMYENTITRLQAEYDAISKMLGDEDYLNSITAENAADYNKLSLEAQLSDYAQFIKTKMSYDERYSAYQSKLDEIRAQHADWTETQIAEAARTALGDFELTFNLQGSKKIHEDPITSARQVLELQQDAINEQMDKYRALIAINNNAISKIKNNTIFNEQSTTDAKAYEAKLNDIYVLEQQLSVLNQKLSEYQFEEEHAKSGQEWVEAIYSENAALEAQNSTLEDLTNAQKAAQNALLTQLSSMSKAYKIIDGRMVPVMSEYVKLSDTEKEALDNAVESFNGYSDSINSNTQQLQENSAAIEENLQKIEDKTVELYDKLADAIKNSEQKKLDTIKASFDEEKKLLDKRKKMYEDAYAAEDYTSDLNDQASAREDIIKQISDLEGATDLASAQKRQDLLDQLEQANKDYNTTVTQYNRDALLASIDNQQTILDDQQAAYEDAYNQRISDTEWLESEVTRIMNQGLDYTIQYLKDNSPEYQDAWSITKDNIEEEWTTLYETVNTTVEAIANNIPDFSGMVAELKAAATYSQTISSSLGSGGGSGKTKTQYWAPMAKAWYDSLQEAKDADIAILKKQGSSSMIGQAIQAILAKTAADYKTQVVPYKTGGLANFTGPAWLDGTPSKPERILSPIQTELFDKMIKNLEANNTSTTSNINDSISIGNITIQTPQLNTNTDFGSAAKTFAAELKAAIGERGLNINKKK